MIGVDDTAIYLMGWSVGVKPSPDFFVAFVAKASAVTGGDPLELAGIFARGWARGAVTAEDLVELAARNLPAATFLADALGVDRKAALSEVGQGLVTATALLAAVESGLQAGETS